MNGMLPLILLGVLLNAGAQLVLKEAMNRIGEFTFSWANLLPIAWQLAINPFFILGMVFYVVSLAIWLLVLSRVEVSIAYPMLSVGYIVNAIAAYYLFGENLSITRIAGILVVIVGVYLLTRSA